MPRSATSHAFVGVPRVGARRSTSILRLLGAACVIVVAGASAVVRAQAPPSPPTAVALPPAVRTARYQVNARIRPLWLFWIGRENIGEARITWHSDGVARRGVQFIIGSEPARTPRQINRWGFISEAYGGGPADVLGLMKDSSEESLEEAKAKVERTGDTDDVFKAVRSVVSGTHANTRTFAFVAPSTLTFHDVDRLVTMVPAEPRVQRSIDLPSGSDPGFLSAITTIFDESAEPCRAGRGSKSLRSRPYPYNQTVYELSLTSCQFTHDFVAGRRHLPDIVEGHFQVRNQRTGEVTKFDVAFGLTDQWRAVPVRMTFRPRWWMELELVLADVTLSKP